MVKLINEQLPGGIDSVELQKRDGFMMLGGRGGGEEKFDMFLGKPSYTWLWKPITREI